MINTVSKRGWEGGGSTSIWIMSKNILFVFFDGTPKDSLFLWLRLKKSFLFIFLKWG